MSEQGAPPPPPQYPSYPQGPYQQGPYAQPQYAPQYPYYAAPAGPAPGLRYAGFWIRLLAIIVDGIIIGIPLGLIALAFVLPSLPSLHCATTYDPAGVPTTTCTGLTQLSGRFYLMGGIFLLLEAAYFTIFWSWQGQTLGQKLCGLHVVDAHTGGRIGVGRAFGRYIGYLVSRWVLYIGLIWAAFDARKQGWHDKMASTFVVRRA